jgi:hypothetical protein
MNRRTKNQGPFVLVFRDGRLESLPEGGLAKVSLYTTEEDAKLVASGFCEKPRAIPLDILFDPHSVRGFRAKRARRLRLVLGYEVTNRTASISGRSKPC